MKENYYKKFIRFLKEHNLYDAEALEYLRNNGVFFDFLEEENRDYLVHLYENMAEPKAVVAVGACACSGGIFEGCGDVLSGADQVLPVDLYVPGCAARPEIIIDGMLKCFEKPETLEEPVAVEDPAKDEQEKIEEKPEDVEEEEQDGEE